MAKRIAFGPFLLDTSRGTLVRDGVPLPIGRRAMLVLRALLESPGEVVSKDALIDFAWPGLVVEDSNLSVQIAALRRLLGEDPGGGTWIVTVPRAGYRIAAEVAAEEISLDPAAAVPAADGDRRASIAVLPLVNLGEDASQEWFVDGVTEDIISALARAYSDSFELAIPAAAKAVELSPGFALGHLVLGLARLFAGDPESAARSLERGLQLNRYDPQNFIWYHALALAFLFGGRPHEALQRMSAALQIRPAWRPSLRTALACCCVLQQDDDARRMIERIRGLPEVAGDALQPLWRRNPQWAESIGRWARSDAG